MIRFSIDSTRGNLHNCPAAAILRIQQLPDSLLHILLEYNFDAVTKTNRGICSCGWQDVSEDMG